MAEGKGGWIATICMQFPSHHGAEFLDRDLRVCDLLWSLVLVSMVTTPKRRQGMEGLVYGLTKVPHDATAKWYQRPAPLTVMVIIVLVDPQYFGLDNMDLRVPSGWFFTLARPYPDRDGHFRAAHVRAPLTTENVNLYSGACMLVFGIFLLLMAWRAAQRGTGSNP